MKNNSKKIRLIFLIVTILLMQSVVSGQNVTFQEAKLAVANFFNIENNETDAIEIAYKEEFPDNNLFYIFNYGNSYIVISGDKNCPPVLAYSHNNIFYPDYIIQPVRMWLNHYKNQILSIKKEGTVVQSAQYEWHKIVTGQKNERSLADSVKPFLTSKWGQEDNFNFYCPKDLTGSNGRAVTGCVATAMAQIMYYFRFPDSGVGSYSYQHDTYGTIAADFSEAEYDYNAMTDIPHNINAAASLLIHHCGVAVDMVYGPSGSGMYNHKAAYAMRTHFKYSPQTEYVYRDSTNLDWDSLIVSHLIQKIPLYYAGWNNPNIDGHAFVCDGFEKDSNERCYYHFNFGWDGYADGYFYTDALSPSGYNFNLAQEIIINGYPDTSLYSYPNFLVTGSDTLTDESGSFEDGSGAVEGYAPNMNYIWVIQPELDTIESIKLTIDYALSEFDTLYISSNAPSADPIILTNDSSRFVQTFYGTQIKIEMKSDGQGNRSGFKGNYISYYPLFCSSLVMKTGASGTVEDGSGAANYNSCSRCLILFRISNINYITLNFNNFETEENEDILYIYDYSTSAHTLLAALSGTLQNSSYTFNTYRINLVFETSAKNNYQGWDLSYTSGITGINEITPESDFTLYPNPTDGRTTLRTHESCSLGKNSYAHIYDLCGNLVRTFSISDHTTEIDLSELSSGLYFIKIRTDSHTGITKKIIKQ